MLTLHAESRAAVCRWCPLGHERKVRAAQDTPLVKVPAVGNSWIWEKRMTASHALSTAKATDFVRGSKGEKVV